MDEDIQTGVMPEQTTEVSTEVETNTPEQPEGEQKEVAPASQENKEPNEVEKVKFGMQKRIDKLTARQAQAERALQEAQAELQKLKPSKIEDAPREEDFDSIEAFLKAQGKWEARQEFEAEQRELQNKAKKDAYEKQMSARRAIFEEKEAEIRAEKPDYDNAVSVVNEAIDDLDPSLPGLKAFKHIMLNLENLPAMTYHLGTNPEIIEKLKGCTSEIEMARTLFIEEYKLQSAPKDKKPKQPNPPNPLRGANGGASSKREEEMSGRELRKKAGLI